VDPDPVEIRVLGCLVEKQRTTPDAYPLTLNSLRLACNQSTNRDPVVDYGDSEIRAALERLGRRGWTRMASWGGRSVKYRHLLGDALGLSREQVALLAVLMLRGPQTVAELKARCERLHHFADNAEVEATLARLDGMEFVHLLPKQPGQREERWTHLLAEAPAEEAPAQAGEATSVERRLQQVEERLAELERRLAERGLLD